MLAGVALVVNISGRVFSATSLQTAGRGSRRGPLFIRLSGLAPCLPAVSGC